MSDVPDTTTKPYRRFRAHGAGDEGGLDELRQLTERERAGGARTRERTATPRAPRIPQVNQRRRRRALTRAGRPWWSVRGLGPGGWAVRGAAVLLAAFVVWSIAGYTAIQSAVSSANSRMSKAGRAKLAGSSGMLSGPTNILIVGSDARPGERHSRADTILIMRLDPGKGRIKLLSIPRDLRVYLGSRLGHQKINAAYQFGFQAGIIGAVHRLTAIPINHFIAINFRGFPKLVNDVGGITVNNPTPIKNCPFPGGITVSFAGGKLHLNGDQALQYVRVRKCDDDFRRAERQQAFMAALKSKLASPWSLWKAPWNGAAMIRALTTDMSADDMAKFGYLQWHLAQHPGDRMVLAGHPEVIGGLDYVVADGLADQEQFRRFMG